MQNFPQCVCSAWYEWTSLDIEGEYREIFSEAFVCNLCGRPACFIANDGGNAFIIQHADTEVFLPEMGEYVTLVKEFFRANARRFRELQAQYEGARFLEIRTQHNVQSDPELIHCAQDVRRRVLVEAGGIFLESGWECPTSFNPNPLPPFTPYARVCVRAFGVPPELDPTQQYWYLVQKG